MGNGQSISSLIPGVQEIESSAINLQSLISQLGSLPENTNVILQDIRRRLLDVATDIQNRFNNTIGNVSNAIVDIQNRFNDTAQTLVARIDQIAQGIEVTVNQVSELLDEILPVIPTLRQLIQSIEDITRVSKNIPMILAGSILFLLIAIAIGILTYKFIMEGTARLGIDSLLVLGALMVILTVLLILVFIFLRSQWRIVASV